MDRSNVLTSNAARVNSRDPIPTRTRRAPSAEERRPSPTVRPIPTASSTAEAGRPSAACTCSGRSPAVGSMVANPSFSTSSRRALLGSDTTIGPASSRRAARAAGGESGGLPDGSPTDDQNGVAGDEPAVPGGVVPHGQRLDQSAVLLRQGVRQDDDVARRREHQLREGGADLPVDTDHLAPGAQLLGPGRALGALPAADHGVHGGPPPRRESLVG